LYKQDNREVIGFYANMFKENKLNMMILVHSVGHWFLLGTKEEE